MEMVRTQIQLTEEQARRLKAMAAEQGVSMAELIRHGVDMVFNENGADRRAEIRRRALAVAGRFRSEETDISREHDRYLAEAFGQ
jgi:hypothetical protein